MGIEVLEEYKCDSCKMIQTYRISSLPVKTRQPEFWCRIKFTAVGIPKMSPLESAESFLLCPQCTFKLTSADGQVSFINDLSQLLPKV